MKKFTIFIFAVLMFSFLYNCKEKYAEPSETFASLSQSGCISCHMDRDLLKEVADPLPDTGEGGGEG